MTKHGNIYSLMICLYLFDVLCFIDNTRVLQIAWSRCYGDDQMTRCYFLIWSIQGIRANGVDPDRHKEITSNWVKKAIVNIYKYMIIYVKSTVESLLKKTNFQNFTTGDEDRKRPATKLGSNFLWSRNKGSISIQWRLLGKASSTESFGTEL